jgi:hypothetical protein
MEYMLLVSWFLGGRAISSYQVPFATREACDVALADLRNDAGKLAAPEATMRTLPAAPTGGDRLLVPPAQPSSSPMLSAICINQR